jgi:hypothetical protein
MTITNGETISLERRSRLGLILCRRAANETSRKLANHLVRAGLQSLA